MTDLNKLRRMAGVEEVFAGDKAEYTKPASDEQLDEKYTVPKTKRQLVEKTPETLTERAKLFRKATKQVKAAYDALNEIPPIDFMGDIPHIQELKNMN